MFITFILICVLLVIFFQDLKERKVSLIAIIAIILLGVYLHFQNSVLEVFVLASLINLFVLLFIGVLLFLYTSFKLQKKLHEAIAIGDFLFFFFLAISFPTITFLVLFSISLIFSLILFLILKPKLKHKTVPLAGLQALFLSLVLMLNSMFSVVNLYAF